MTDHDQFDPDDDLRALLRAADPAASVSPADPLAVSRVVRDIVREQPAGRRRTPLTWLAGAAAAAVVLTAGAGAVHRLTDDGRPATPAARSAAPTPSASSAGPSTGSSTATGTSSSAPTAVTPVSSLSVSDAAFDARCAAVNAPMLSTNEVAFSGTVTGIDGRRVTLRTGTVLRGAVASSVTVKAPSADFGRLIQSVHFRVGSDYLVSASDGQLSLCGFSGPATAPLQRLYTEAFSR